MSPGLPLGSILGPFLKSFRHRFFNEFSVSFGLYFCLNSGSILMQFWSNFWVENLCKMLLIFEGGSGCDFGYPRAPSKVKKLDFHCTVVQNRGSTFSHPRAPGIDFGCQNGAEMGAQVHKKTLKNVPRKSIGKSTEKCTKMLPKWTQNGTQN